MVDLKYYRKWAKQHPNFMTPHIISLRDRDTYIIELSEGTDFEHKPIFGVTLLKMSGSTFESIHDEGINKMCLTRKEANSHIKNVIEPHIKKLQSLKH